MRRKNTTPAYIICGGHGGIQSGGEYIPGALLFLDESLLFGASNQGEFGYNYTNDENNPEYENNLFRDFCYSTLPWYYLNRLLRLSFDSSDSKIESVTFSDNVRSFFDENGNICITKDGNYIRHGNDIFIPELWKTSREIMAWSDNGYENKRWKLPADWSNVSAVDLYENTLNGLCLRQINIKVDGEGFLTFSLSAKDGVIIAPAGADPNGAWEPLPPSGTAEFIGQDTKTAYSGNLPGYAKVRFIGGEAALHEIIDVDVGNNAVNVSLCFHAPDNSKCRAVLDVIDANSIQCLGNNNTKLLNNFNGGIYVIYRIGGRVRFRSTRFHFDNFGRDGKNEAALPLFSGLFFGE